MTKTILRYSFLAVLSLLVIGPAAVAAQGDIRPACPLFQSQADVTSSAETPLFLPDRRSERATLICSSVCSHADCPGLPVGSPCVSRLGQRGTCTLSGRICGDGSRHCGCV